MAQSETNKDDSLSNVFLSEYIAPWALPNEEIPIHMVWVPEQIFEEIKINVPSDMGIIELYNVQEYISNDSTTTIKKLRSTNFFGFTVVSKKIFDNFHEVREIKIDFFKNNVCVLTKTFKANIYRPKLTIVDKPSRVILTDNSDPKRLLNVAMKISGFGSVEISTEFSLGGEFTPNVEPLFQEMARRVATLAQKPVEASMEAIEMLPMLPIPKDAEGMKNRKIDVDPVYIRRLAREFIDQVKKGQITLINKQDVEDFKVWIEDPENKETFQRVASEHLENIIVESILYYFNKYPTENVALYGGNPLVVIKDDAQHLTIKFKYRDSLLNEYRPMSIELPIEDLRLDKKHELKIPINMRWIHEQINPLNGRMGC